MTGPGVPPLLTSAGAAVAAARNYAESVSAGVIERDRTGAVPVPELGALDASGLLAITVPRAYGGPELPASVLAEVVRSIAAVDPAIAQVPQAHFLFTDVLAVLGTAGAYIGAIAYSWDNKLDGLGSLLNIPVNNLLTILVGMPLVATVVAWLLAGREPATIARRPMD